MIPTRLGVTVFVDILDFNGQKGKPQEMKVKYIRMNLHIRCFPKRKEES